MNKFKTGLVLLAAGSGTRMQANKNKVLIKLADKPLFLHALEAFIAAKVIDEVVLVCKPEEEAEIKEQLGTLAIPCTVVYGGTHRQHSVASGLSALGNDTEYVMVHDSARPYISPKTIKACHAALIANGSAVVGVFTHDTIKRIKGDVIVETLERQQLINIQTPQCFKKDVLLKAHKAAKAEGFLGTDDSVLVERLGLPAHFVEGEYTNIKITTPADLKMEGDLMKVGHGMDVHAFADKRKLILGGVTVPHPKGLAGHSDADVLVHAIMDALLGAAGLPDIGQLFPDTDKTFEDVSSIVLLTSVSARLKAQAIDVCNIDATLAMQAPKVGTYIPAMRENIAKALGLPIGQVNVKATTTEHLGYVGREEGVTCHAVCLIKQRT